MYRKQLIIASIVVFSLLLTVVAPAMAQDSTATPQPAVQPTAAPLIASTGFFATADFRVNVRSGPGTQYTVLDRARPGDALDITGRTADNRWLRVNFNGQEGWVSAALFSVTGDIATAPEAEAGATAVLRQTSSTAGSGTTGSAATGDVVVITRVNANLRAAPSVNADVLTTIPFDTTLTVTGRNETNNWVRVTFDNQTGWVSSGVLFFQSGNIDNITPLDASGNPVQATAQPTPEATASP